MNGILSFFAVFACSALAVPLSAVEEPPALRIANGILSSNNQFPYVVSLQANDAASQALPTRGHRCGGVLITMQHVLTVASCLYNLQTNGSEVLLNPANFQIFGGAVTLDGNAERIRSIGNFTIHPEYVGAPAYINDIAIINLTSPFNSTSLVPLRLPSATWEPRELETCTIAGWGATAPSNNPQTSPTQRYANMYFYKHDLCQSVYSTLTGSPNVFPSMVCAASYDIKSTGCVGDNGSALVCNGTLTGLLFYNNNCVGSSLPELYTRVSNHTAWIQSITGSVAIFTPSASLILLITLMQICFAKVVS